MDDSKLFMAIGRRSAMQDHRIAQLEKALTAALTVIAEDYNIQPNVNGRHSEDPHYVHDMGMRVLSEAGRGG